MEKRRRKNIQNATAGALLGAAINNQHPGLQAILHQAAGQLIGNEANTFTEKYLPHKQQEKLNSHIEREQPQGIKHAQHSTSDVTHKLATVKAKGMHAANDEVFEHVDSHIMESMREELGHDLDFEFQLHPEPTQTHAEARLHDRELTRPTDRPSSKDRIDTHQARNGAEVRAHNDLASQPHQSNHNSQAHNRHGFFNLKHDTTERDPFNISPNDYKTEEFDYHGRHDYGTKAKHWAVSSLKAIRGKFQSLFPTNLNYRDLQKPKNTLSFSLEDKIKLAFWSAKALKKPYMDYYKKKITATAYIAEYAPIGMLAFKSAQRTYNAGRYILTADKLPISRALFSEGSNAIIYKTTLGAISGAFGSFSSGGDPISVAFSSMIGATIGGVGKANGIIGKVASNPYASSTLSNLAGQKVSQFRNPEEYHFSIISPIFSLFGTGAAEFLTRGSDVLGTNLIIGSMPKAFAGAIGKDLAKEYKW